MIDASKQNDQSLYRFKAKFDLFTEIHIYVFVLFFYADIAIIGEN